MNKSILRIIGIVSLTAAVLIVWKLYQGRQLKTQDSTATEDEAKVRMAQTIDDNLRMKIGDYEPNAGYFEDDRNWQIFDIGQTSLHIDLPGYIEETTNTEIQIDQRLTSFNSYKLNVQGRIDGYAAVLVFKPDSMIEIQTQAKEALDRLHADRNSEVLSVDFLPLEYPNGNAMRIDAKVIQLDLKRDLNGLLIQKGDTAIAINFFKQSNYKKEVVVERILQSVIEQL